MCTLVTEERERERKGRGHAEAARGGSQEEPHQPVQIKVVVFLDFDKVEAEGLKDTSN